MSRSLHVERIFEAPPQVVWRTLIRPASARQWLGATGFQARVGARFTAELPRGPGFDGHIQAQILEVKAPEYLRISWLGGPVRGEVRVALTPTAGGGTRLTIDQTGFESTSNPMISVMTGWWAARLEAIAIGGGAGVAAGGLAGGAAGLAIASGLTGVGAMLSLLVGALWCFGGSPSPAPSRAAASQIAAAEPDRAAPPTGPLKDDGPSSSQAAAYTPSIHIPDRLDSLDLPGEISAPAWGADGRSILFRVTDRRTSQWMTSRFTMERLAAPTPAPDLDDDDVAELIAGHGVTSDGRARTQVGDAYYDPMGWSLRIDDRGVMRIADAHVQPSTGHPVAVTADGRILAYVAGDDITAVQLLDVVSGRSTRIETGLILVVDPAIRRHGSRLQLAFTALTEPTAPRSLHALVVPAP